MGNFPQITHLDVQVYFEIVPALESKITTLTELYLWFRYIVRFWSDFALGLRDTGLGMPIAALCGGS